MVNWYDVWVFRCRKVTGFAQKLAFCLLPISLGLTLLLRNDLDRYVAMNLVHCRVNITKVSTPDALSYFEVRNVVIHCDRFPPAA